jgi:hypothetical protein
MAKHPTSTKKKAPKTASRKASFPLKSSGLLSSDDPPCQPCTTLCVVRHTSLTLGKQKVTLDIKKTKGADGAKIDRLGKPFLKITISK